MLASSKCFEDSEHYAHDGLMKRLLRLRRRYLALLLCLLPIVVSASIALAFPTPSIPWLSRSGTGSDAEATQYYATIFAPPTFALWKATYGFDGVNETRAVYYNAGDLGFGRDMHCRRNGGDVACYVANHGLGPGGPPDLSVEAAIAGQNALPFVAMVYKQALQGNLNDVSYYIYDQAGNRVNKVALDSDGDKYAPHLCLPCHGGYYDPTSHSVSDANFLPFDAPSFKYSQRPGYILADQQEKIRQLNAIVSDTSPNLLIVQLITGWYAATGGVYQSGSTLDGSFVAPGFAGYEGLYDNVVKPYCRSCHIAQGITTLEFPTGVDAARFAVFTGYYMPHAEMTSHNFWGSSAPAYLARDRGWSLRVTRLDDPSPDGCASGDCSLREAILAANANLGQDIITFDVDGIFLLSRGAKNEDFAFEGDLDIADSTLILGNGADRTIIDGNNLDRVFDILEGANVVIQGVTIQHGSVDDHGGGVYNSGGRLVLNASVVKDNVSSLEMFSGAGIVSLSGATTEINNSTIGPNNAATSAGWGGGIFVSGSTLILNNSTVSGNQAEEGAGIYVSGSGVVTITHGTIAGNQASSMGGGMRNDGGTVAVNNTIVAGNGGAGDADCAGSYTSLGHNLVGQNGSANGCSTGGTDIVLAGAIGTALDTNLVAQEGAVPYHALVLGGPAIDAIPLGAQCMPPSYDQRNLARPLDGNADGAPACDIGAYEAPAPWSIFLPLIRK